MTDEVVLRRGTTIVRRLRLAPGEATHWHRDPYHRLSVVLSGDELAIEFRDGGAVQRVPLTSGEVGWDEPTERIHRGVNVGDTTYEELTVFFADREDAETQPAG